MIRAHTLPSFWKAYRALPEDIRRSSKKAYRLWQKNPFHPSLHFKCVNHQEHIWSLRIALGYRALGIYEADMVTWFWVGDHEAYERLIKGKFS